MNSAHCHCLDSNHDLVFLLMVHLVCLFLIIFNGIVVNCLIPFSKQKVVIGSFVQSVVSNVQTEIALVEHLNILFRTLLQ